MKTLSWLNRSVAVLGVLATLLSARSEAHIIGLDERMTFEQYAQSKNLPFEEVDTMFSATGIIACDGWTASAQLTGTNDVITTTGHNFFDPSKKTCDKVPLNNCMFMVIRGSNSEFSPIDIESIKTGGCKLTKRGDKQVSFHSRDSDWAVMKLQRPIKGSTPYEIPDASFEITPGLKIIQATAEADNFVIDNQSPKHIGECSIRDIRAFPNIPLQTDCDSGRGGSGSAQLIETESGLVMVAMQSSQTDGANSKDFAPYISSDDTPDLRNLNFSVSVPMTGKFLEATQSAISSSINESQNNGEPANLHVDEIPEQ